MSVKATINGEVWEFSTPAEAAEFRHLLGHQTVTVPPPANRKRGRPPKPIRRLERSHHGRLTIKASQIGDSRQILEAIRRQPDGLQSEDFAQAIGSPNPRAVPIRMMMLGKALKAAGLKPEDVIQRSRIYVKSRARSVFKPGPRLDEAIRLLGR